MEDQQPATGDLTEEPGVEAAETEAAPVDSDGADASAAEASEDGENADETTQDDQGVVRFRERRPATKWSVIAAAVAAVLFVGAGAFAGAMMQPYLADRATVATKLNVAQLGNVVSGRDRNHARRRLRSLDVDARDARAGVR